MIDPWITSRFPGATVTTVTAGWSEDRKFRIATAKGTHLLRLSPADALSRKQEEFAQLRRLGALAAAFPQARDCGLTPDGQHCFVLYGWVDGTEALTVLPDLSAAEQYKLGREAGQLLSTMHSLPQDRVIDSHAAIRLKVDARKRQMREAGLHFDGYEAMVRFIEAHLPLLDTCPTAYRHGDFHLGNMLIDDHSRLKVIDFNRSDFGDPLEDFNRLFTFTRQASPAFARGQIAGYFGPAGPPPDFFAHVLCYVLIDCAFGLLWARRFGQKEIKVHLGLIEQILRDFDGLQTTRPGWFAPSA